MPIHLRENLIVEFALMHKYGIFTVLPFSKYANPIFAQRKPNRKLHFFLDLRKSTALIADEDTFIIYPVKALSDAAQHLAGKSLKCKLEGSQAYHCLQMADQWSLEIFGFNFASRTFAYWRLVQHLSSFVFVSLSFMREKLDPMVKADQCAHYEDDIGIAAINATDITRNVRAVSQCLRWAWLKLTFDKYFFGVGQVAFLGRNISLEGVSPQTHKIQRFFLPKWGSSNRKSLCSEIWGWSNFTELILPAWMKRSTHSENIWRQKSQSKSPQNWK